MLNCSRARDWDDHGADERERGGERERERERETERERQRDRDRERERQRERERERVWMCSESWLRAQDRIHVCSSSPVWV